MGKFIVEGRLSLCFGFCWVEEAPLDYFSYFDHGHLAAGEHRTPDARGITDAGEDAG